MYYHNVLETIGNTPLVKLNKVMSDVPALVLAKVESTNPGNSVKDRMALRMVEDAEKDGRLRPGGTIIECTSGNTGMGLALAAVVKGYKAIFTTTDKQSKEKVDALRAVGAEVIVCPNSVERDDPRSYYSTAERLSKEIPNSFWCNQYENPSNVAAHYEGTGPEIWKQTEGKITHFVVGVGTGGVISGVGKYLKEQNPNIQIWGIDTYGSIFKKYKETGIFDPAEINPYIIEGIGQDNLPSNVNFGVIDLFEKVTDKDAMVWTRRLAREEGILTGGSAGAAACGINQLASKLTKDDVVVVLFHDHATRYMGKIFNDDWMRDRGFLDEEMTVKDIVGKKKDKEFLFVEATNDVRSVLRLMKERDISQLPVMNGDTMVGSVTESTVLNFLLDNPFQNAEKSIDTIMGPSFPEVAMDLPLSKLSRLISKETPAAVTKDKAGMRHIVTDYDILQAVG